MSLSAQDRTPCPSLPISQFVSLPHGTQVLAAAAAASDQKTSTAKAEVLGCVTGATGRLLGHCVPFQS